MTLKISNSFLAICLTGVALSMGTFAQQHQQSPSSLSEQSTVVTYLQGLGLDVDQNTIIVLLLGTAMIAVAAIGLESLFVAFLLFGRPILHQLMSQMNGGAPGANPMDGVAAAAGNVIKNLFGGQDLAAIISRIIGTILPTVLRTTSQFVTDQANPTQGRFGQ